MGSRTRRYNSDCSFQHQRALGSFLYIAVIVMPDFDEVVGDRRQSGVEVDLPGLVCVKITGADTKSSALGEIHRRLEMRTVDLCVQIDLAFSDNFVHKLADTIRLTCGQLYTGRGSSNQCRRAGESYWCVTSSLPSP